MWKKLIRITLIILVGIFILIEGYLRLFEYERLKTRKRDLAYIPDSLYSFRYQPNSEQELIWPSIKKKFKFNNHGFYGPDFSINKPEKTFRIALVGTSNALGIKTDSDENFAIKLQRLFKNKNYRIEIINCSLDGSTRDIGNINMVKHLIPQFKPDLVLFEYKFPLSKRHIAQDLYRDYLIKYNFSYKDSISNLHAQVDKIYSSWLLTRLYDISYSIRGLCWWLANNDKHEISKTVNENIIEIKWIKSYIKKDWAQKGLMKKEFYSKEESVKMYDNLNKYLDSLNIAFEVYEVDKCDTFQINKDIPYISLNIPRKDSLLLEYDNGHYNHKGHELIANEFFKILTIDKRINQFKNNLN